jgi:hypothetical protein
MHPLNRLRENPRTDQYSEHHGHRDDRPGDAHHLVKFVFPDTVFPHRFGPFCFGAWSKIHDTRSSNGSNGNAIICGLHALDGAASGPASCLKPRIKRRAQNKSDH